jgi:phosphate butyryltransferase
MLTSFKSLFEHSQKQTSKRLIVAAAEDKHVLEAVKSATEQNLIEPVLVGDAEKITEIAQDILFSKNQYQIVDEPNQEKACNESIRMIREEKGDFLMKGLVPTKTLLKAVLNAETGIRQAPVMSHVALFETPYYHKLIAVTDAAMNIAPTVEEKISIINNATLVFHRLHLEMPKVAVLAPVEVVNPKMTATVDAALLKAMNQRGQITGCLVEGPLAFDNAISKESALLKHIDNSVSGDADILLVHDINTGNVLYKALNFMGGATSAAVIMGAQVPIVLTSRADNEQSKLMSIALANLLS